MSIATLVWVSVFTNGLLFTVWTSKDWVNFVAKFIFGCLTVLCLVILVQTNGFSGIELK